MGLTMEQVENAAWRITMMILGFNPDSLSQTEQKRVRISWPLSETGSPNWTREENVAFLRITPSVDNYDQLWDVSHSYDASTGRMTENVSHHRCYSVNWICYGPNAAEWAETIRFGVLRENVRAYLKTLNLAFKPILREPNKVPEQDQTGEWWNRYDVASQCYELSVRQFDADYIDTPPTISIHKQ